MKQAWLVRRSWTEEPMDDSDPWEIVFVEPDSRYGHEVIPIVFAELKFNNRPEGQR